MVPDREECLRLLSRQGVPDHIVAHSAEVARIAVVLARALVSVPGEGVSLPLVEAGALLHDIDKMTSIRDGGDHCALGAATMERLGLPQIAPLVARHVNLGLWDPEGPVTEAELVNYADKRVRHTEMVSLSERFEDLMARYGHTAEARARIESHRRTMFELERKIFSRLPFGPQEI
jgi:uncharacterized protein